MVLPALFVFIGLKRIMRPVEHLIAAAREVASGNFGQTIAVRSGDEIGVLAQQFNKMAGALIGVLAQQFNTMAGALKESYTGLEQKVAARTGELRESEERYRSLFEESRDAIFVSNQGGVVAANEAALELFGFTRDEAIGSDVGDRYADPNDRDRFRQEMEKAGFIRDFEVKLLKKDGTVMDCLLTATRRHAEDGAGPREIQGLVRDITERKRAEEALLQQTREVAVLEERNRMAREIHDTLAQGFTGIVIQIEAGEQTLEESPGDVPEHLSRAKGLARESLQEARRSVWNLTPQALEQRPLAAALEEEVKRFPTGQRERASFKLSGERRDLPLNAQAALLRICQESLTNVRRHAKATEVNVELAFYPEEVRLGVRDNGIGFDWNGVRASDGSAGFGLVGMEQRALLLGGSLTLSSSEDGGTLVEVRVPTS